MKIIKSDTAVLCLAVITSLANINKVQPKLTAIQVLNA